MPWLVAASVQMIGGLVPAMLLACQGPAEHRLLGLELAGATGAIPVVVPRQTLDQPGYLIVPLVLLSFAGTLVFTRLPGAAMDSVLVDVPLTADSVWSWWPAVQHAVVDHPVTVARPCCETSRWVRRAVCSVGSGTGDAAMSCSV